MKTLCAFAFLLLLSTSASAGIEKDKQQHILAGVLITSATYIFTDATIKQSLTVGVLAGLAKEVYDIRTTGFNIRDFAATAAGSGAVFFYHKWRF